MYKHTFTHIHPYTYKYTYICSAGTFIYYTCMYAHTSIYTHIFHSMWTPQTSTHYAWEAEPGVPGE